MAKHILLAENETISAIPKYLSSITQIESAEVAERLLKSSSTIEVRDVQIPLNLKYTCWYVSIVSSPKLPIINFTLQNNGSLNVEFRYMQFIAPLLRDKLKWQTGNWPYARISPSGYTEQQVIDIMNDYIPRSAQAINLGMLKRGGTSAAEKVIDDVLLDLLGKNNIIEGERPEWLRNKEGNLLQLDFYLPKESIAIEVQGPTHFKDIYNKPENFDKRQINDMHKVSKCLESNISMIWMNSVGIQNDLVRMQFRQQKDYIKHVLEVVKENHPCYVIWENPNIDLIIKK